MRSPSTKVVLAALAALLFVVALVGVGYVYLRARAQMRSHAEAISGGDARRGEAMFIQYGCGSCHTLKNVRTAMGSVGPPLDGIAIRTIIGGHLANTPDNMQRWIRDPQAIDPQTAMPVLGVSERDAVDMSAYLLSH